MRKTSFANQKKSLLPIALSSGMKLEPQKADVGLTAMTTYYFDLTEVQLWARHRKKPGKPPVLPISHVAAANRVEHDSSIICVGGLCARVCGLCV